MNFRRVSVGASLSFSEEYSESALCELFTLALPTLADYVCP